MTKTLAERLKQAMAGPPRITQAALAKACGVSPPSVSDWCRGVTKSIEGVYLVRAASFLKVRPRWLSEGVGPREIETPYQSMHMAAEEVNNTVYARRAKARLLLEGLPEHLIDEAINHMEWLVERDKKTTDYNSGSRQISGRV
jgi:transcriptional regulator with XRE-family HTH domain